NEDQVEAAHALCELPKEPASEQLRMLPTQRLQSSHLAGRMLGGAAVREASKRVLEIFSELQRELDELKELSKAGEELGKQIIDARTKEEFREPVKEQLRITELTLRISNHRRELTDEMIKLLQLDPEEDLDFLMLRMVRLGYAEVTPYN